MAYFHEYTEIQSLVMTIKRLAEKVRAVVEFGPTEQLTYADLITLRDELLEEFNRKKKGVRNVKQRENTE